MQNVEKKNLGFVSLLVGIWRLIQPRRRIQLVFLALGMVAAGLLEMLSLGAFAPLLAALAAPERVAGNFALLRIQDFVRWTGYEAPNQIGALLGLLAFLFAGLALLAGIFRILVVWANARFTALLGTDINAEIFERCLYLSYTDHLNRGAGELISLVRDKAGSVGSNIFFLLNLFASILISLMICAGLFILHPKFTLFALVLIGGFYVLIGWMCRDQILLNSRMVAEESTQAVKAVQEGFGSIRDVILDGSQAFYCRLFRKAEGKVQKASALMIFLSSAPRYFTDTFAMVVFAGYLAFWLYGQGESYEKSLSILPTLGVLALGAQRTMPLLQQIYVSWTVVSGSTASLQLIFKQASAVKRCQQAPSLLPLQFKKNIALRNASFRYQTDLPWVVRNFNLNIVKGSFVGIRGETGCGKSTLVDIIMGLIQPRTGTLEIDGVSITPEKISPWQKNIAHVPQSIFLADVSVAENIALGFDRSEINMTRVQMAARQACISDFIESTQEGYKTKVGERGVRLSGGQRQRIGIARAIYRQPSLLVLDEATSALDITTEKKVMKSIKNLTFKPTVLIISHRTETMKNCDQIINLNTKDSKKPKINYKYLKKPKSEKF